MKVILLYDENGQVREKFKTRALDKTSKNYVIRAINFSSDSEMISVAQSDNVIFVFKFKSGGWKVKSICNRFVASSSVTCQTWPFERLNEIYYGLADGKIKVGYLKGNKTATVRKTDSYVVSIATSYDSNYIITGHYDSSVYLYSLQTNDFKKIVSYKTIPYALGAGKHIVIAGNDGKVNFYDTKGNFLNRFDYTNDDNCRDFTSASVNPNGETVVIGNYNRFYMYNYDSRRDEWIENGVMKIKNYYNITAMCWKFDGSKFVTGNLCGSVDLYDISMKRIRFKGKFELNYISPSQIHVLNLETSGTSKISSAKGFEIIKVNILEDRYAVANTRDTLVIGDLKTDKCSEFEWRGGGNERFDMKNSNLCLIFNAGEVSIIEFGRNEILGTFRTEYISPNLISAKLKASKKETKKVIAYMLDLQTVSVLDLQSKTTIATINHDTRITSLELNANANKLLFKDKKRGLYLYDLNKSMKNTLLDYCAFYKWVPESEVLVAQNRNSLCVWYSSECPEKVNVYPIKGSVYDIKRSPGKTNVVIIDGNNETEFALDNSLIEFGFALESRELEKCIEILEKQDSGDQEGNWRTLAELALEELNLPVAERSFAALGDIPKSRYLRNINKMILKYQQETGRDDGVQNYLVQVRIAKLERQFTRAEALLLDKNEVEKAMDMYQEMHKWDEVIRIAEKTNYEDLDSLKSNYFQWLMDTKQESKAAEIKEEEGQYAEAIELYLKSSLPVRASNVINDYSVSVPSETEDRIVSALIKNELFEKAGEFYEKKGNAQKALEAYCKGNVYNKAVELARRKNPNLVNKLEEKWGDYLVSQNMKEAAINHYIEAISIKKAIKTAILARKWRKARELLESQPIDEMLPFYFKIAEYYDEIHQFDLAEKYYITSKKPRNAFAMYARAKKFDQAKRVAQENIPNKEILELYIKQGKVFEEEKCYKEAEQLYTTVRKPEYAIKMYQKAQMWDHVVRLVAKFNRNKLQKVHLEIAKQFEDSGKYDKAEFHYIESGYWNYAVEMYENKKMWEDCIRVCKSNATDRETVEIAKKWNKDLGEEQFIEMLKRMNLTDALIEYLADLKQFDEAFDIAKKNSKHKIPDVHLKYAFHLEDQKKYREAEENFIQAGKLDEAITMYTELGDYSNALRLANQYDPKKSSTILLEYGKQLMQKKDFNRAEKAFIDAKRPELAIKMYEKLNSANDALRVARKHCPQMLNDINKRFMTGNTGEKTGPELLRSAKIAQDNRDWNGAIDTYLEITEDHFQNHDDLEKAWDNAVRITLNYVKERSQEVLKIVCKRLRDIKRFEQAGEYYENLQWYDDACKCYIASQNFERAKESLQNVTDQATKTKLERLLKEQFKKHIKANKNADAMVDHDVHEGIKMMAERGDWAQALDIASKKDPSILNIYLMKYIDQECIEKGEFNDALQALSKHGMPNRPENTDTYRKLIDETFAACEPDEIENLRSGLFNFMNSLSDNERKSSIGREFKRYQIVTHLIHMRNQYKRKSLQKLYAFTSVSLVRYIDLTTIDKPFYEAGQAAHKMVRIA